MTQLDIALPGVSRMERLFAHYRFTLAVPQAPEVIEVKAYEDAEGRYRFGISHRPLQKGKSALKKPSEPSPFERVLQGPYPSVEIGLGELMREVVAISANRQAAWEANPHF